MLAWSALHEWGGTFTTASGCGSVAVNGTPLPSLETVAAGPGYVPLTIQPCEGTAVGGVTAAGGVYYDSSNGTVDVLSSGSILVQFAALTVATATTEQS